LEGTVSRSASITIPDIVLLVRISSEIAEVMNLLEVRLFRLPADFLSTLSKVRMQAVGPAAPALHTSEDPFAPGNGIDQLVDYVHVLILMFLGNLL
jgi:hypothetical protein